MPPKSRPDALRGPGRPKRAAATAPTPTVKTGKRGRPAKTEAVQMAEGPPKKRGRAAKAQTEAAKPAPVAAEAPKRGRRAQVAPAPVPDAAPAIVPKKRIGRPRKDAQAATPAPAVNDAPAPKKRGGRPRKEDKAPVTGTTATPKRGRPAKKATGILDLDRVTGSPRVTKRTSAQSKAAKPAAAAPRITPRIGSKLRTRMSPAQKAEKEAPAVQTKRGRPRKSDVVASSPVSKRKTNKVVVAEPAKPTKRAKSAVPRKPRGYTMIKVADKFAAQVQQYYENLLEATSSDPDVPSSDDEEADVEQSEVEVVVVLGQGQDAAGPEIDEEELIQDIEAAAVAEEMESDEGFECTMEHDHDLDEEDMSADRDLEVEQFQQKPRSVIIDLGGSEDSDDEDPTSADQNALLPDPSIAEQIRQDSAERMASPAVGWLDVQETVQETVQKTVQVQQQGGGLLVEEEVNAEFVLHENDADMP